MEYNFMDLYAMMSPDDQDKLIGNMLKGISGEETESILSRITVKVSNLGTEEEIKERIAVATGIPKNELPISNIRAEIERNRANWNEVNCVTQPLKALLESTPGTTSDKFEELIDLGRFIVASPEQLEIVVNDKLLKYPDFVVKRGNENIGIEHTRLIDPNLKAISKVVRQFLDAAHSKLSLRDENLNGTVNVFINFNTTVLNGKDFRTRDFTKVERDQVWSLIADYIESEAKGLHMNKPPFIDRIAITDNMEPRLDIIMAEKYLAKDGFANLINSRIQNKESKFVNYINEASVDKCWLLIIVDGINGFSGFDLKTESMKVISNYKFDKIILFETFSATIRHL